MALPDFSALMILLAGVAAGLVEGTTAPTTPIGRAISVTPVARIIRNYSVGFCVRDVAQQAQGFAMIFCDFIGDIAQAGGLYRQFG